MYQSLVPESERSVRVIIQRGTTRGCGPRVIGNGRAEVQKLDIEAQ